MRFPRRLVLCCCCIGFGRRPVSYVDAKVSEKHTVTSALKMETACFSETLAATYETAKHPNPRQHQQ
jgi:hypothetical protein